MIELRYTCIINKNLVKPSEKKTTYFAEQEKRMLSFHIFNDLPNDFWGKVLKPRLLHAISIETLPRGINRVCEELFFYDRIMAFEYDPVAIVGSRDYLDMTLLFFF